MCLFHDQHSSAQRTRALNTCGHMDIHNSHTYNHRPTQNLDMKTNLGYECCCEREHWCDRCSGSPLSISFFLHGTFVLSLRVFGPKILVYLFCFVFLFSVIYPMPTEYALQPSVIVFLVGKGCHSLIFYITCFMAAVSLAMQERGI